MEGRDGFCISRYAGGAYDTSKFERIMVRFRPIAPKPCVGGSVSGKSTPEKSDISVRKGRPKRRYVRYSNNNNDRMCSSRKKRIKLEGKKCGSDEAVVTLPLLQEIPDRKDTPDKGSPSDQDLTHSPILLNFNNLGGFAASDQDQDQDKDQTVVMPQPVGPFGSCVILECITDTCVDAKGLGSTDEERRMSLERDTCPGFMSDSFNRVGWTNEAYRRLVGQGGEEAGQEMVWLVMKERLFIMYPAFACLIRIQYTRQKERNSMTVPCDVWRMDGGGFAWRLDVKAALSLGR